MRIISRENERRVVSFFVLACFLFVLLIFSAPLFAYLEYGKLSSFNYLLFSSLCHQIQERAFSLFGHPCAVCARCTGIYIGFLVGVSLFSILWRRRRDDIPEEWILYLSTVPVILDFFLNVRGVYSSIALLRFATGFLPGLLLPFYIIPGVCEIVLDMRARGLKSPEKVDELSLRNLS
ncbi:MAG: DUF2085 domain-containing protein [Acidobacteriota bacterium]